MVPILDYGGEIWRIYDWEGLEKTDLFACKHILNVNMNTATDAIYAETGCTPLVAKRQAAAAKFSFRLSTLSSDRLSRKVNKVHSHQRATIPGRNLEFHLCQCTWSKITISSYLGIIISCFYICSTKEAMA